MSRAEVKLRKVLREVLERDGGKSCGCIGISHKAEIEYETGKCPHQRAAALLEKEPR